MRIGHRSYNATSVKSKIAPYDFYLREQNLHQFGHKSGQWAVAGLCPFHADSSAGSFKVNVESGSYICFSCNAKGSDIIAFTMSKYDLSFYEALKQLVNDWGLS